MPCNVIHGHIAESTHAAVNTIIDAVPFQARQVHNHMPFIELVMFQSHSKAAGVRCWNWGGGGEGMGLGCDSASTPQPGNS